MDREKFREIWQKFSEAYDNYQNYVKQFFNLAYSRESVEKTAKMLNRQELKKIKKLREEVEKTKKEVDEFLRKPNK